MRKITSIICAAVLMLCLCCSCKNNQDIASQQDTTLSKETSTVDNNSSEVQSSAKEESFEQISSEKVSSESSSASKESSKNTSSSQKTDPPKKQSGVLAGMEDYCKATRDNIMNFLKHGPSNKDKSTFYDLSSLGNGLVDWECEGDIAYLVCTGSAYKYAVVDTNTGKILKSVTLDSRPYKMRFIGSEIWISYPDIKTVRIYNKGDFSLKKEYNVEKKIAGFDTVENKIYFCTEGHAPIYIYDIQAGKTGMIQLDPDSPATLNCKEADILIDKNSKLIYINEIESPQQILVYDRIDWSLKTTISSYTCCGGRTYLKDGFLYAGGTKMDVAQWYRPIDEYNSSIWDGRVLYVGEKFLLSSQGIFNIVPSAYGINGIDFAGYYPTGGLVTKSGHIVLAYRFSICVVPNH